MRFINKSIVLSSVCLAVLTTAVPAWSYQIDAKSIYQQAQKKDAEYFRLLSRYKGAIDLYDGEGNTAYCLALKNNDKEAQAYLAARGANQMHSCVKKLNKKTSTKIKKNSEDKLVSTPRRKFKEPENSLSNNGYLWGGAGLLLIGGGVAAFSGGGGGGSGNSGGSNGGGEDFDSKTEYQRGNFLDGIKASGAYSHMGKNNKNDMVTPAEDINDSNETLLYQANSDSLLKKVKVGVLDTGVYTNQDLTGKIVKSYDFNDYDKNQKIWMHTSADGRIQDYVVKKDDKYYLFRISDGSYFIPIWQDKDKYYFGFGSSMLDKKINWGMDQSELEKLINWAWDISFSDLTLINNGVGFPKVDVSKLDPNLTGKEIMNIWGGIVPDINHGTHVAGIIAANKDDNGMHGVAFQNAEILGASWGFQGNQVYDAVKTMVDDGAEVLNHSWGNAYGVTIGDVVASMRKDYPDRYNDKTPAGDILRDYYIEFSPKTWNAYVYAAKNHAVWVQATGNESKSDAGMYTGMGLADLSADGYTKSNIEVPFLAVAALDYGTRDVNAVSGKIASYSNICGNAAGYCLAAPGTDILSTSATDKGHMYMSGTSMATPVVSGSIALINGYYPWLNAQNVAFLLLQTANKNGEYAKSNIYGQGALDLEAAVTTPIGPLGLPLQSSFSSLVNAQSSKLSLSGAMQNKLWKAMPDSVTVFDILDRPFEYSKDKLVNTTHSSNAHLRQSVAKMATAGVKKTVKDERNGFQFTSEEALSRNGQANFSSAEVLRETADGASRFYYAANSKYATADNVLKNSSNPYLAMNEAYGAENMLKLSDTSKLRFSIQTGQNGLYERDYEQDKHSFNERAYSMTGEYSFNMTDYLEVAALGGMLFENDAMLGMNGTGALGIKDSSTYFMGVRAALNLTPEFSILAAYYRGYTQGNEASLLTLSDMVTESFMLAGEYNINKKEKVGLSLTSPLSVVKGRASLLYANGRDMNSDTIYMQKLTTSLKPEAKEYDLGLYYQGQPKEDVNLMGKIEARFNADGEKGVTDYIGIVGAGVAF